MGAAKMVSLIGTTRADASKAFYQDTLGLKFVTDDTFAFVFDMGGAELRVSRVPAVIPAAYAVLGFQVKDIAAEIDALVAKSVKFERFGFFQQDERGIWAAPDGTKVAWFRDPDMNMLSLVQHV
ncbi:MAG: VOC family protein [Hyphomonadaceae bacterium]|nr:VOC family protein [Hyphomonadaceae bacterium]